MPWNETHIMVQKVQMISDHLTGSYCPTELSRIYGVIRKGGPLCPPESDFRKSNKKRPAPVFVPPRRAEADPTAAFLIVE